MKGFIEISAGNQVAFSNTRENDLIIFTSSNSQRLLLGTGTNSNLNSTITISSNNVDISGNVNFSGSLLQAGSLFQTSRWNPTVNGIFSLSNVSIGTSNINSRLNVLGEVFIGNSNFKNVSSGVSTPITNILVFDNIHDTNTNNTCTPANKIRIHTGNNNNWIAGFGISGGTMNYHTGDSHAFWTLTSNVNTYGIERMRIMSDGRIGIGMSNPTYNLDVRGTARTSNLLLGNSTDTGRMISALDSAMANGTNRFICFGKANNAYNQAELVYTHVGDGNTTNRLTLGLFGVHPLHILGNGNIGIGTNNPVTRLTIMNDYNDATTGFCLNANDGSTYQLREYAFVQGGGQVGYKFDVLNGTSTNTTLTLGHNGTVGIGGITHPAATLDVAGNIKANEIRFTTSGNGLRWDMNTTDGAEIKFHSSGNGAGQSYLEIKTFDDGDEPIVFTQTSEKMRIHTNGFVGIGTNNPSQRLDVAGAVRCERVISTVAQTHYQMYATVSSTGVFGTTLYGPGTTNGLYSFTPDTSRTYNISTNNFGSFTPPVNGVWQVRAYLAFPSSFGSYRGLSLVKNWGAVHANINGGGIIIDRFNIGDGGSSSTRITNTVGSQIRFYLEGVVYLTTSDNVQVIMGFTANNTPGSSLSGTTSDLNINFTLIYAT
jgi:hypothetical protein